ncbi:metal-sulfur cluster assembly factor [Corynebacterium aquatimens]|uniref:Metal-sulfur cluster biosynthetic enzyme n=1 Tax=Corynebacterium aquatimens TaxID=1190508 RepID=A0A931E0J7_9CORY|nr:metal-sulfur cluster assembly factor [Corynebacterium aquatimens]MBG6121642.1 metal-sulfur cluster biosynthetic enzyme [Corynebacterium aquatimens]WJY65819.1 hypothetical protein CAQUA_05555 [Corynebacterium aquatimens]
MTTPNATPDGSTTAGEAFAQTAADEQSASNFGAVGERPSQTEAQEALAADVAEYLHDVIDPELGINVVDLGLVYDIWIEECTVPATDTDAERTGNRAVINMTLTSPACPLTDVIEEQCEDAAVGTGTVDAITLNWVWMPPWTPQMITEDGREQLRALGFSI